MRPTETVIRPEHLPQFFPHGPRQTPEASAFVGQEARSLKDAVADFGREYLRRALEQHRGNKTRVAAQLGISLRSLTQNGAATAFDAINCMQTSAGA